MPDDQSKRQRMLDAILGNFPDLRFLEKDALGEIILSEWKANGPGGPMDLMARLIIEMQKRHQELMRMVGGDIQEVGRRTIAGAPAPPAGPYRAPMTQDVRGRTKEVFVGGVPDED